MSAPTTSSEFSLPRELVAQASRITSREVQQLQTMNRVLVDRLMQVEAELKSLKEGNEDEGRVMQSPTAASSPLLSESPSFQGSPESFHASPEPRRPTRLQSSTRILATTPLPDYHPGLPPIDRTILNEEFYADLQDKRIIPGYDDKRFSCWCHVAKSAKGSVASLSIQHIGSGNDKPFRVARWFQHAAKCDFYKDPWATDADGERLFPQFPLQDPSRPLANAAPIASRSPAAHFEPKTPAKNILPYVVTRHTIPRYSPHLPAIDGSKKGKDFYIHLRDAQIIASLGDTRYTCWCHLAKDVEKGIPGKHSKSHADGGVTDGMEGGRYRVSKFYEHARTCAFVQDPWATDDAGQRLFPHFPLANPTERISTPTTATKRKTSSSTATRSTPAPSPIAHYSPYLPPIDTSLTGEPFFAHLRNEMIIASYDATRFSCWCHIAKDVEKGMATGSHGKSHAEASANGKRHTVSMFYEHARRCAFFTDPWATSDGQGARMYPQFPLEKPARPYASDGMVVTVDSPCSQNDADDAAYEGGRSLRKRKKIRYVDW